MKRTPFPVQRARLPSAHDCVVDDEELLPLSGLKRLRAQACVCDTGFDQPVGRGRSGPSESSTTQWRIRFTRLVVDHAHRWELRRIAHQLATPLQHRSHLCQPPYRDSVEALQIPNRLLVHALQRIRDGSSPVILSKNGSQFIQVGPWSMESSACGSSM